MPSDTTTNRYGSIAAEIYDIDKPLLALPDTRFHLERFRGFCRPILEPACGSGRTLLPFLQAGLDVSGFDPSPEMLERCRVRCAEAGYGPDLSRRRYGDFAYPRRFGAIVIPVGSFTLIDDFATAMSVLTRFRDHLEPGGVRSSLGSRHCECLAGPLTDPTPADALRRPTPSRARRAPPPMSASAWCRSGGEDRWAWPRERSIPQPAPPLRGASWRWPTVR